MLDVQRSLYHYCETSSPRRYRKMPVITYACLCDHYITAHFANVERSRDLTPTHMHFI